VSSISAAKGSFAVNGRARPSVEHLGFRPDAVVTWWTKQGSDGVVEGNVGGIGFWTPRNSGCIAWASTSDREHPATTAHAAWDAALLGVDASTRSVTMLADSVAFGATGFGLTWATPPRESWVVHYLALAGTRAFIASREQEPPDGGLTLAVPARRISRTVGAGLLAGFGAAARDARAATAFAVPEGAPIPDVVGEQRTDVGTRRRFLGPRRKNAWCLRLEGIRCRIGATLAPIGPGRVPVTVGFRPVALLVFSWGLSATARKRRIGRLCLGAAAGNENGCAAWDVANSDDGASSHASSTSREIIAIRNTRTTEMHATAVLAGFEEQGFALEWTQSDGIRPREVVYVALG
jgi:hypothetical protein